MPNYIQFAVDSPNAYQSALMYIECGLSVIPVSGKIAAVNWSQYQVVRTPFSHVHEWHKRGLLQGVAIVCGGVSDNFVVIDLDGQAAVQTFREKFPQLCETLTIATGSGQGEHLYYRTIDPTVTTRTKTETGGFELRSDGCYVVAPPSRHPSGNLYTIAYDAPVMELENLNIVRDWIRDMIRAKQPTIQRNEPRTVASGHNPRWVAAAVNRELSNLAAANEGNANDTLNAVSYRLARICVNPNSGLTESDVKADIIDAAQHLTNRDGLRATLATIESGWNAGIKKPAHIPEPKYGTRNR